MPKHKLFICYSKKDRNWRKRLETHLAPWVRAEELEVWSDQEILAGDDWNQEIEDAIDQANGALMLVSPEWCDTDYVIEHEVPRLMRRAEAGQLALSPLYLRDSTVQAMRLFNIVDADSGETGIAITKYQGVNQPDTPLANEPEQRQDTLLKQCAERIWTMLNARGTATRPGASRHRPLLEVELEVRGKDLLRHYHTPAYPDLHHYRDTLPKLPEDPGETAGEVLFETLFGPAEQWRELYSRLPGEPPPTPLLRPLRVRVRAADPRLAGLPWSLARWGVDPLVQQGWSFELAAGAEPQPLLELEAPCSALLIATPPTGDDPRRVTAHRSCLDGLLRNTCHRAQPPRDLVALATDLDSVHEQLALGPPLVYIYGRLQEHATGTALELAAGQSLPLADLAAHWGERPPRILIVHSEGAVPTPSLATDVPLLLQRYPRRIDADSRKQLLSWLEDVLGREREPVQAFCDLPDTYRRRACIRTHYRDWRCRPRNQLPKQDRPRVGLDRHDARMEVGDAMRTLAAPQGRVACIIAYAAPGNLVHYFVHQMADTLRDDYAEWVRIQPLPLTLPEQRHPLWETGDLLEQLRDVLQLQPAQDLAEGLVPRPGAGKTMPVFLLDWGGYGGDGKPALHTDHLDRWLDFCRDYLVPVCANRKLRILSYLAVETAAKNHPLLREWAEAAGKGLRSSACDFRLLPALGRVAADDLARFLKDEHNSSCPKEYLDQLPERIVAHTGGEFEAIVQLLEETERSYRWTELRQELAGASPSSPKPQGLQL